MPRFTIRQRSTGRELTVEGPQAPNPQQMEALFAREPEGPGAFERGLDIATAFGSFFPPTAIPSRVIQAGLAAKNLATGNVSGGVFNAIPALFGSKGRAAAKVVQGATKTAPTLSRVDRGQDVLTNTFDVTGDLQAAKLVPTLPVARQRINLLPKPEPGTPLRVPQVSAGVGRNLKGKLISGSRKKIGVDAQDPKTTGGQIKAFPPDFKNPDVRTALGFQQPLLEGAEQGALPLAKAAQLPFEGPATGRSFVGGTINLAPREASRVVQAAPALPSVTKKVPGAVQGPVGAPTGHAGGRVGQGFFASTADSADEIVKAIRAKNALDPENVRNLQAMVGTDKAARLLGNVGGFKITPDIVTQMAGGRGVPPLPVRNARMRQDFMHNIQNPRGVINTGEVAIPAAGAIGGALVGGTAGESVPEQVAGAALGAVGGGLAGLGIAQGANIIGSVSRGARAVSRGASRGASRGVKVFPNAQRLQQAQQAGNPRGFLRPEDGIGGVQLVTSLGGGAVGALAGGATGETPEDRVANAIVFGGLGAIGGALLPKMLAQAGPAVPGVKATLEQIAPTMKGFNVEKAKRWTNIWRYFSMLSGTNTLGKMAAGTHGSMYATAVDLMAVGEGQRAAQMLKNYYRILLKEGGFGDAIRHPKQWEQFFPLSATGQREGMQRGSGLFLREIGEASGFSPKGWLTLPGRMARAFDATAMKAMRQAGVSDAMMREARTFALSGQPTSQLGQDVVKTITKSFPASMLIPFPRVGVQVVERGMEFSPLGFIPGFTNRMVRGGKDVMQLSRAQANARAAFGTGAAAVGTGLGATGEVGRTESFLASAAAGPAALPLILGYVLGDALQRGLVPASAIDNILNQLSFEIPAPDVNAIERLVRGDQALPGIVKDIAKLTDPFERTTQGQGFFAPVERGIPFVRERLPIDFRQR